MKIVAGALLGVLAYAGAATAGVGDQSCAVAAHLVQADAGLAHVQAAIATKTVKIVVAGTASSALPGAAGQALAYPQRLEAVLQKRLPGVTVKVISMVKPRQTAAEMAETFPKIQRDEKPALLVWQTGTVDAMRGISTETFQATLEEAVDRVHEGGADVILMNPQYSPRTDTVISIGPYVDAIRWVALERSVNLFDRQAVMRQWSELGTFDLFAATKSLDTAAKVHDCIGHLLAELVMQGIATDGNGNASKDHNKQ